MHGNKKKQRPGFTVYKKTRVNWSLLGMLKNTNGLTVIITKTKRKSKKVWIFVYKMGFLFTNKEK